MTRRKSLDNCYRLTIVGQDYRTHRPVVVAPSEEAAASRADEMYP